MYSARKGPIEAIAIVDKHSDAVASFRDTNDLVALAHGRPASACGFHIFCKKYAGFRTGAY